LFGGNLSCLKKRERRNFKKTDISQSRLKNEFYWRKKKRINLIGNWCHTQRNYLNLCGNFYIFQWSNWWCNNFVSFLYVPWFFLLLSFQLSNKQPRSQWGTHSASPRNENKHIIYNQSSSLCKRKLWDRLEIRRKNSKKFSWNTNSAKSQAFHLWSDIIFSQTTFRYERIWLLEISLRICFLVWS